VGRRLVKLFLCVKSSSIFAREIMMSIVDCAICFHSTKCREWSSIWIETWQHWPYCGSLFVEHMCICVARAITNFTEFAVWLINWTRAVQPMATCHQLSYLHKPAVVKCDVILIVTSLVPTALAAPVLIMMSLSLWYHPLLSWPRPPLRASECTDTLPCLMYKDDVKRYLILL